MTNNTTTTTIDQQLQEALPPARLNMVTDIGPDPEPFWTWYRPLALLLAVAGTILVFLGLLLLSPLLFLQWIGFQLKVRFGTQFHQKHPQDLRVAIIGGGWGGLQAMGFLQKLGVTHMDGYERWKGTGGCWNSQVVYCSQAIHTSIHMNEFDGYTYEEYLQQKKKNGEGTSKYCKLRADKVEDYTRAYADHQGFRERFQFSANVKQVLYDSKTRTASLEVEHTTTNNNDTTDTNSTRRIQGPYDMVLWTSMASDPLLPTFLGQDSFRGQILHSQSFTQDVFRDILETNKKVTILGGGKTALDLLDPFLAANASSQNDVTWVYRNAYIFLKSEKFFATPSLLTVLFGLANMAAVLTAFLPPHFHVWFFSLLGSIYSYDWKAVDYTKFKGATLDANQRRRLIERMPRDHMYHAGIAKFVPNGIVLMDGRKIETDVVLLGTSTTRGFENVQFVRDGTNIDLTARHGTELWDFVTPQEIPILSVIGNFTLSFGPKKVIPALELAVHHLCCHKPWTKVEMTQATRLQPAHFKNPESPNESFRMPAGYDGIFPMMAQCALSLWASGLLDFFNFFIHVAGMLCFSTQTTLKLGILPPLPNNKDDCVKKKED